MALSVIASAARSSENRFLDGYQVWPLGKPGLYGSSDGRAVSAKTTLAIVRMWQTEKTWVGPHWKQTKDGALKSVGVARYGKRKGRIVADFHGKSVN